MKLVYIGLIVLVCIVIEVQSERMPGGVCYGCHWGEFTRTKRAKYYSNPPLRFYNRPPMAYPIKGLFSMTSPPGYLMDDDRQSYLRPKVSKRPTNDALEDEDVNNVMKFLSQQDLDKLVQFGNDKEKDSQIYSVQSFERPDYFTTRTQKYNSNDINYYNNDPETDNDNTLSLNGPFVSSHQGFRPSNNEDGTTNLNELKDLTSFNFAELQPSPLFINKDKKPLKILPDINRLQNQQFTDFSLYSHRETSGNRNGPNIFTDSSIMQEELLPKPSNLREDDFEVSYTNNIPTVINADSHTYKFENLGALPLMNYHSKLDTVDSYKVPQYTVTSSEKYRTPASKATIPVEPAPPASEAQQQSDAHLKAIKIWTHKSKGTAYTLHRDGTLSLERPNTG